MSKLSLKNAIKQAFLKQQNPTSTDAALESVSNDISQAIYDHVVEELQLLKGKLLTPGAFVTSVSGSLSAEESTGTTTTNPVSAGTISTYTPGIS